MKTGIIGSGVVGRVLANAFLSEGHDVMLGTRNTSKDEVVKWKSENPKGKTGTFEESLMERIQKLIPNTKLVKAFNSVGYAFMYKPNFPGGKPTMFICGNDDGAKKKVTDILTAFGFETEDMGKAEAARAIEPLSILWCIPGFIRNQWTHAFKLLKM